MLASTELVEDNLERIDLLALYPECQGYRFAILCSFIYCWILTFYRIVSKAKCVRVYLSTQITRFCLNNLIT